MYVNIYLTTHQIDDEAFIYYCTQDQQRYFLHGTG